MELTLYWTSQWVQVAEVSSVHFLQVNHVKITQWTQALATKTVVFQVKILIKVMELSTCTTINLQEMEANFYCIKLVYNEVNIKSSKITIFLNWLWG